MSDARVWLTALAAFPSLVVAASFLRVDVERLRRFAVASSVAMLLAAVVVAVSPAARTLAIRSSALTLAPEGEAILRLDMLSAVLLPFAAALWLLTGAGTPRGSLDRGGVWGTGLAALAPPAAFFHAR